MKFIYSLLFALLISFSFTCFAQISHKQLYKAVINGEQQTLKMAINQGVDINQVDENGIPLLNHAANFNQLAMVKQLIRLGAKVNQGDKSGFTPLLVATTYLHTDIAKALIENYADVTIADNNGLTPLQQAKIKGDKSLQYLLIRAIEKQQRFNLVNPRVLAAAIYETAQNKFYGIEKITSLAAPKTLEQVIKHYKYIVTKQCGSLVLRVLSSDKAKAYTAFNDYLPLLKLAKQHIPQKYWLAEFSLYSIVNDTSRFQAPLHGMMIENQRLDFLLANISFVKEGFLMQKLTEL
jgi:flagellar biosynthesis/type III secretory pathway chaperone